VSSGRGSARESKVSVVTPGHGESV
jgi:hypothetical protein